MFSPSVTDSDWEDSIPDPVDAREIFDLIRNINDPEHPLSLEQLDVVKIDDVDVNDNGNRVKGWKISKKKFTKLYLSKERNFEIEYIMQFKNSGTKMM